MKYWLVKNNFDEIIGKCVTDDNVTIDNASEVTKDEFNNVIIVKKPVRHKFKITKQLGNELEVEEIE